MMENLIRDWNGETVITRYDRPSGAWIFIAIYSTHLGPAGGGTRMKTYPDAASALRDAQRLAEGMTYKLALSGMNFGGGKAVIAAPEDLAPDSRPDLLRRYGKLIRQLGGLFYTGPDIGTSATDMNLIAEAGAPYVFGRTASAGGAGSSGPATALGVFAGMQVASELIFGARSLKDRRVLVQGAGSVGGALIDYLQSAGAEVIFSDVEEGAVCRFRDGLGLQCVPAEEVYHLDCDIFAPCAGGQVLNAQTISQLKCRVVAGSANNQLAEPEDAQRLKERGILYAPDYVINFGGAMFLVGMETQGWTRKKAEKMLTDGVQDALSQIFELALTRDITTESAARQVAEQRLSRNS
ncbi:MAG: Glu/Leu/Phe/Val dehydrogenase [Desulfobacterales bacterium]|nr:MAG: Glu/Leu/Phe/Val dehydrogenase [Desulfobacterales bacterium]